MVPFLAVMATNPSPVIIRRWEPPLFVSQLAHPMERGGGWGVGGERLFAANIINKNQTTFLVRAVDYFSC